MNSRKIMHIYIYQLTVPISNKALELYKVQNQLHCSSIKDSYEIPMKTFFIFM